MNRALVPLFLALSTFAVSANAVPPLISTLAARLGIPASKFGFLLALQFLSFSAVSFTGGAAKKKLRLNNYHLVAAGLFVITLVFAMAPVVMRSLAAILLWIVPLGLAGGAVETFSSIQISALSASGTSKNLCVSQGFYSIGAIAAPQFVYLCFGAGLGWESTFVAFTAFSLVVGLFFIVGSRKLLHRAAGGTVQGSGVRGNGASTTADPAHDAFADADRRRELFHILAFLMLVYVVLEGLTAAWLAYSFEVTYRISARTAALGLAVFWTGMAVSRFSVVLLPDRFTLWPVLLVCAAAVVATTSISVMLVPITARYVLAFLLGAAAGPMWPVIVMATSVSCGSERRTAAVIGIGAVGFGFGPFLGSLVLRAGTTVYYFLVQTILAGIVLVLCLFGHIIRRKAGSGP